MQEFTKKLISEIRKIAEPDVCLQAKSVLKANDTILQSLLIGKEGVNISKTIYLDAPYRAYKSGRSLEAIAKEILYLVNNDRGGVPDLSELVGNIYDYESVKNQIIIRLVSKGKNELFLKEKLWDEWLDLAMVYCLFVQLSNGETGTMAIPCSVFNEWNVNKAELKEIALRNMKALTPANIVNMSDFLRGRNMGWDLPADNQMFILSNDNNQYGSAAMMIPGIIKNFSEKEAVDKVVILPSSTHEVLLLPVYEQGTYDVSALVSLVRQVNSTEVSSDEILSDKVYIYERQNDDIRICREDELF